MKILFIGNFEVSYSTENHHKLSYEKLGHKVITIQENKTNIQEIQKHIDNIDLLVHTHTHGWQIKDIDKIYKILKQKGIPAVGYHLDLFKGIKREIDFQTDPYWNIEYFFTCDKGFIPDLQSKGIKAYYLPAGVLEDECYIAEPNKQKYPHDIIFVGSKGYHPEWPYRPQLINWLQETYSDRFGHYGGDGLGTIRGHELNVLYASAKVVVGDTLCKNFNYPYYFSDRLFETTGRGGFMIFPDIKGIEYLFNKKSITKVDGLEIINYKEWEPCELVTYPLNDFVTLKYLIDHYLEHDKERESIRIAGHERTKKDHTYTQRLQYLLNTVFEKN